MASTGSDSSAKRRRRLPLSLIFGSVLAVVGVAFVVVKISQQWSQVRHSLAHVSVGWLVLGVLLATVGMVAIALAWRPVLVALGAPHVSRATVIRWYFVGEIGKYVPGGIWSVAGRSELSSRRGGMPRSAAYGSVALSLFLLEIGAAIVAAVAIPFSGIEHKHPIAWLVILLLPVGLAVLHPRVLSASLRGASKAARRELSVPIPDYRVMLRLIAGYVPAWFAIGGGTWAIARSLDPHAPFGNVFTAAVISWIVGFLLVPVPGGVGVREGAFTALVSLPKGIAATAAILARLAFMLVDGGGAVLAPLLLRDRTAERAATEASEPDDPVAPTSDGAPRVETAS
ncbi:MAG TPA: lysylphosphatidylglycerol synthase transmembrane domain-containing protein [Acidimicrobiia bacterium]